MKDKETNFMKKKTNELAYILYRDSRLMNKKCHCLKVNLEFLRGRVKCKKH